MQRTAQRLGKVVMPAAFYCVVALSWSTVVSPIPDVTLSTHYWYTLGLEFIWVYAATVFMAPWFGLAKSRLSQKSYTTTVIAVGILAFVVNGYIAAMSTTSAGEFSWLQKLMSAATYVIAFLIGGLLRDVTDVMDSDRAGTLGMRSLAAILALATILEGALSFTGNLTAMAVLSYKSTSLISFALAAASLLFAATRRRALGNPRNAGVIVTLSTATLGFYVMQSLTSSLWRPVFNTLLANILVSQNSRQLYVSSRVPSLASSLLWRFSSSMQLEALSLASSSGNRHAVVRRQSRYTRGRFLRFIQSLPTRCGEPLQ